MARNSKSKNIENIKAEIEANRASNAVLRQRAEALQQQILAGQQITEQERQFLKFAQQSIDIENRRLAIVQRWNASLKDIAQNLGDISEYQSIINEAYGKGSQLAAQANQQLQITQAFQSSIAAEIENNNNINEKGKETIAQISAAYGNMQISIINADKALASGEITLEKRNQLIEEEAKKYARIASAAEDIAGISQETLRNIQQSVTQATALEQALNSASVRAQLLDDAMGEVAQNAGPLGNTFSSINKLIKTNVNDTLAWKAALFAVGAAMGAAAMDYFGAPAKAALQSDKERAQNRIDTEANIAKLQTDAQFIPQQIEQERLENRVSAEGEIARLQKEAGFAGAKAAIQFSAQMQSGAAAFERAAKTALFGKGIGSVGYGAAQLQLAGVGAEKIASGMEAAAAATGRMPSAKVGADMAVMAERTGTSVDNIASINEMFQRMDGVSESTAMNLSEGLRNMADQAKIGLGGLMREIADASKDALSYQIKSGPALAKQVAYAQSLGVSFGDIAKAGKSMVMNYKDSIKQEMQLSAMLGKNVDLSEVRAKFASGDTAGALESLKAQGLDPAQMDMFQQDALSQALGGMDLSSLQKIATKQGAQVGGLQAGNAGAGNQDFLSRTQAAESTLASKQASISANTAVLDAQLSQKIADSYLGSDEYKTLKEKQNGAAQQAEKLAGSMKNAWLETDAYKKSLSDSMQLDFISSLKSGFLTMVATVGGGILTTLMGSGLGKLKNVFSGFGGAPGGGAPSAPGGGAPSMPGGGGPGGAPGGAPGGGGAGGGFTKGLVDSVKNVSTVLKSIITELGAVLKSGVDVVMQLANKLASGVMTTFNTIMSGLSKASSTMPTILGNLGKAIGSFFSGMGSGLVTFAQMMATPTALFGLPVGLIVMAMMMGLAAALRIAAPGIEALTPLILGLVSIIGDTFVKALQAAGPIITSIFEGIGLVIEKVGNAISGIINSITDSISRLGGLNPGQLLAVAGGIAALAGAVAIFGGASAVGGALSKIGEFFGGDPVDKFIKFQNLDPTQLQAIATSITNLAKGISAFGVLSAVSGVATALQEAFTSFGNSVGGPSEGINSLASGLRALNEQLIITTSIAGSIDVISTAFINLAYALDRLASVNTKALNDVPWIRMTAFAGAGGRITLAQSANNSFNIAQDTAKNIEKMATNTEAMVKLNNTIAKLLKEGFFGTETVSNLYLDGKQITTSFKRYKDNTKNQNPE